MIYEITNYIKQQVEWNKVVIIWEAHLEENITLFNENMKVLNVISIGEFIFLTGCVGTCKSYLLNCFVKKFGGITWSRFRLCNSLNNHLNGMTLDSFVGASPHATIPK